MDKNSPAIFEETETQMISKLFEDHVKPLIEAHKRSLAREVAEGEQPTVKKLYKKFQEEFGESPPEKIVTFFEALLQSKKLLANVERIRKSWQENK
jgi:superfamily I DNA/RNA helicase